MGSHFWTVKLVMSGCSNHVLRKREVTLAHSARLFFPSEEYLVRVYAGAEAAAVSGLSSDESHAEADAAADAQPQTFGFHRSNIPARGSAQSMPLLMFCDADGDDGGDPCVLLPLGAPAAHPVPDPESSGSAAGRPALSQKLLLSMYVYWSNIDSRR